MRSIAVILCLITLTPLHAQQTDAEARAIFKQLIEINTTDSAGNVTEAADAVATRLKQAGFPAKDVQVIGPAPTKKNLVARFPGTGGGRPILFIAHLDVVEARREDWSVDPFTLLEREGYFYGRGTVDIKDGAAILAANFIRLKRENFHPTRDLILALTAGEESGESNGIQWLLENHRDLIDAEYCINVDSGEGHLRNGKPVELNLQTSEKLYHTLHLDVKNPGGHSSLPVKDNAIYRLAAALGRISAFEFPAHLTETTKAYFEKTAALETGQVSADMKAIVRDPSDRGALKRLSESPYYNAQLRTTCVATQLSAGHAENALPQSAQAVVNCRILPGESATDVERTIRGVIADDQVIVTAVRAALQNQASPLRPDVVSAIERTANQVWPGVTVVPEMETGGTDGFRLRIGGIPTYGSSGVFIDVNDYRAHGKDERIPVQSFYQGLEYMYRLMQALSQR
jgi:acetylornithine deacetylase/succinyl-diaminopimelate desuccinylase-like protein